MKKIIIAIGMIICFTDNVWAGDNLKTYKVEQSIKECTEIFQKEEQQCTDKWSMRCYDYLMSLNYKTQKCYVKIMADVFSEFYGQDKEEASEKANKYVKFMREQYLFIYGDTIYCRKNNCGISPYLYSEYATTQALENYVTKAINAVRSRQ